MSVVGSEHPFKVSAARRRGDAYEEVVLGRECLRMLEDPAIQSVRHEPAEYDPAGDVVVESRDRIDALQAKHAISAHALIDLDDLLDDPHKIKLTILRLWTTWLRYEDSKKPLFIHVFSNRAAGADLAKLLDGDRFAVDFIEGRKQKTAHKRLRAAVENPTAERLGRFLRSIRFDLRQPGLDELRAQVRAEYVERRLGLPAMAAAVFFEQVQGWYEARRSTPITREAVLEALPIDRSTLPQIFPVDTKTLIDLSNAVEDVVALLDRHADGYSAVLGPPGSGKSTLLTQVAERLQRDVRPVVRYYGFIRLTDPDAVRRVTREEFVKSIIEQLYASFGDDVLPSARRYDYSPQRLLQLLAAAGERFRADGKVLVLIVDGLDHIARARTADDTQKLFSVLPDVLPAGVRCLLGSQSISYAPRSIQLTCGTDRQYAVPPFTEAQAQEYLCRYAAIRERFSGEQVAAAARLGEGLPLYLRYVAERLTEVDTADIDRAIGEIPPYTGDIDAYYSTLWSEASDLAFARTCGVLARVPFPVHPTELPALTGLEAFEASRAYAKVRHLLLVSAAGCRIFHNSFREFVVSHLSDVEVRDLDVRIFQFLQSTRASTRTWYEHIVTAARLAGETLTAIAIVNEAFVDGAIGTGVPASRVKRTIRDVIGVAATVADAVAVARLTSLLNNTHLQLSYHLDVPQLIRTLLALDDPESALVRTSDALDGRSISDIADVLIALARIDRRDVATDVARSFLRNIPQNIDNAPDMMQVARVVAAYSRTPASYLSDTLFRLRDHEARVEGTSSALVLLPDLLALLERVNSTAIDEVTKRLEQRGDEARELLAAWRTEATIAAAHRAPDEDAAAALFLAAAEAEPHQRVRLAGEAALRGCSTHTVRGLLGEETYLPPTDNDAFMRGGRSLAIYVRSYVAALVGAERDLEYETVNDYLLQAGSWLSVYWRAMAMTMRARVSLSRHMLSDATEFLRPLELLISHRKPETERVYEVFPPIRHDVARLLRDITHGFMRAQGNPALLIDQLGRWGSSELITFQFGLGVVVHDYAAELEALEIASEFPRIHKELKPLAEALHEKVAKNVVTTFDRSSQLLRASELAARIGLTARARAWRDEGVRAARGYGVRKDHTVDALIDAAKIVDRVDRAGTPLRLADILDWCRWMGSVTDGKGTKWFYHYAFDIALEHDQLLAANLLRTYAHTVGQWRYSACLAKFLQTVESAPPRLSYVWSECIDECTWDEGDGTRDRLRARAAILRSAETGSDADAAQWIRRRVQQTFIDEIPPELRGDCDRYLNAIETGATPPELKAASTPATHDLDRAERSVEIDGMAYTQQELTEVAAASLGEYARIYDALQDVGKLFFASDGLRSARERLVDSAADVALLDAVVETIGNRMSFDSDPEYARIGDRYGALGARKQQHEMLRRAFAAIHSWGLHDKKLDYLLPLIDDDPEDTLQFLLRFIAEHAEESGVAFGAATLLVRALDRFPAAYHPLIVPVYEAFHTSVKSLFVALPALENDPFGWLRTSPLVLNPLPQIAFDLISSEWKQPALHRRIALTHLLTDLAVEEPASTIEQLVGWLSHRDDTLRVLAALVLDALALRAPALLQPWQLQIRSIRDTDTHAAILHHLTRVLRAVSAEAANATAPPILRATPPSIEVPSGVLRPSLDFNRTLERVMIRIRERERYAAEVLHLDMGEIDWRIERALHSAGFDFHASFEAEKSEWADFSSPAEKDVVPFEATISRVFYHAAAKVFGEITGGKEADARTQGVLSQIFPLYDAALPFQWPAAKPADLRLREAPSEEGTDAWLSFEGVPTREEVAPDGPVVLFDSGTHGTREWSENIFRVSCVIDSASVPALAAGTIAVNPRAYIEVLAARDDERSVTIELAQHHLHRQVAVPRGTRSAIALHTGVWWHALPAVVASVSRELIDRYRLTFESPFAMHLSLAGRRMVSSGWWADGVRARDGFYQSAGSGYRVSLESPLLTRLRSDGYAFVISEALTRRRLDRWGTKPPKMQRTTRTIIVT